MSAYLYSGIFCVIVPWWCSIKLSDIAKCLRSGAGCSPTETDVFFLAYSHVCAIHRFLSVVQSRSHSSPFSVWDGWKTMHILDISSTVLLVFYLLLCLLLLLSIWESSCSPIAEWIPGWKHQKGCFPMWYRFSSIQVYIVIWLLYRGHLQLLHISGWSLSVASSLLMCILFLELQSESSTGRVCVIK